MIEANVEILKVRTVALQVAAGDVVASLNTFTSTRGILDDRYQGQGSDMTGTQRSVALNELTALVLDVDAKRDLVAEAFTATEPLPDVDE